MMRAPVCSYTAGVTCVQHFTPLSPPCSCTVSRCADCANAKGFFLEEYKVVQHRAFYRRGPYYRIITAYSFVWEGGRPRPLELLLWNTVYKDKWTGWAPVSLSEFFRVCWCLCFVFTCKGTSKATAHTHTHTVSLRHQEPSKAVIYGGRRVLGPPRLR